MAQGRCEDFGLRWQSAAATPLFDCEQSLQSGVALRFPPQSKKIWFRLCVKFFSPGQRIQLSAYQPPAHFNPMTQPATPLLSKSGQNRVLKVICILVLCAVTSCGRHHEAAQSDSSATNASIQVTSSQNTNQSDNLHWDQAKADALLEKADHGDYQEAKDAALAYAAMIRERTLHNPPSKEVPLPNYPTGPLDPRPMGVNFYQIDDRYPTYLLCMYDVEESHYDQVDEPGWFEKALQQIRSSGSQKFPPIKWIAVAIFNRAEHKGASTFEQSFKVGAIFSAGDVFDQSRDPLQLVGKTETDRHPFKYDQPSEPQQRWLIVERHAATNPPTAGSH